MTLFLRFNWQTTCLDPCPPVKLEWKVTCPAGKSTCPGRPDGRLWGMGQKRTFQFVTLFCDSGHYTNYILSEIKRLSLLHISRNWKSDVKMYHTTAFSMQPKIISLITWTPANEADSASTHVFTVSPVFICTLTYNGVVPLPSLHLRRLIKKSNEIFLIHEKTPCQQISLQLIKIMHW